MQSRRWVWVIPLLVAAGFAIARQRPPPGAALPLPVHGETRLALRATRAAESTTRHRLGGEPDLAADAAWPSRNGAPLAFIAQIDLADVARVAPESPLPHEGVLAFFYDVEDQPWGFDPADRDGHRVVWSHGADLVRRAAPAELGEESRFDSVPFAIARLDDTPAEPASFVTEDGLMDYMDAREQALVGPPGALDLKVLGNPNAIQDARMELEAQLASNGVYVGDPDGYRGPRATALRSGASEWHLLLQVGSEGDMMWGDAGRLYVWIRDSDLREGRFDRTWVVLQCF